MNWDDVRYFLALVRCGTLSAASRLLGVEHSTVSRRIESLEAALGVRMFDRLPRGWTLTTEGNKLYAAAASLEREIVAFERAAKAVAIMAGTVRISAPPLLTSYFLMPRLRTLQERFPEVEFDLVGEMRPADVLQNEVDIALRLGVPSMPDLVAKKLGDIGYDAYAVPEILARPCEDWTFLAFDDSLPDLPQKLWLTKICGGRRVVMRSSDMALLYRGACEGLGITVLPNFIARMNKALAPVPETSGHLTRPLYLIMHRDLRRSPRVRAVADGLAGLFQQHGAAVFD